MGKSTGEAFSSSPGRAVQFQGGHFLRVPGQLGEGHAVLPRGLRPPRRNLRGFPPRGFQPRFGPRQLAVGQPAARRGLLHCLEARGQQLAVDCWGQLSRCCGRRSRGGSCGAPALSAVSLSEPRG